MNNYSGHKVYNNDEMKDLVRAVSIDSAVNIFNENSLYLQNMIKNGLLGIAAVAGFIGLYYLWEYICWTLF